MLWIFFMEEVKSLHASTSYKLQCFLEDFGRLNSQSVCRSVGWLVRRSVRPSVHPSVRPSVRPSVSQSVKKIYWEESLSCRSSTFLITETTDEIFQSSKKQDLFKHILKSSSSIYESSSSQFFRTTTGIQLGAGVFDKS